MLGSTHDPKVLSSDLAQESVMSLATWVCLGWPSSILLVVVLSSAGSSSQPAVARMEALLPLVAALRGSARTVPGRPGGGRSAERGAVRAVVLRSGCQGARATPAPVPGRPAQPGGIQWPDRTRRSRASAGRAATPAESRSTVVLLARAAAMPACFRGRRGRGRSAAGALPSAAPPSTGSRTANRHTRTGARDFDRRAHTSASMS